MDRREKIFVAILTMSFVTSAHAQSQGSGKGIGERRAQIESLKANQEKSRNELEALNLSLQKVTAEIDSFKAEQKQLEQSAAETGHFLNSQRQELLAHRTVLDQELKNLEAARRKAEREIYTLAVEIDRYRLEITKSETRVQEAQTRKAAIESEEAKLRADWTEVKAAIAEHKKAYDGALADIAAAKKHHESAALALKDAKLELARMEKVRGDASKRAQEEVAKYEREIAAANRARLVAEAEQIRMETEVSRVQEYATKIRAMRDRNADMQASAETLELKSSLAVEAARINHARAMEAADQVIFKKEREKFKPETPARDVASVDTTGRLWTTIQDCQSYQHPKSKDKAAFFEQGRKLLARKSGTKWVEIMNGSGASVFMESKCGKFEN